MVNFWGWPTNSIGERAFLFLATSFPAYHALLCTIVLISTCPLDFVKTGNILSDCIYTFSLNWGISFCIEFASHLWWPQYFEQWIVAYILVQSNVCFSTVFLLIHSHTVWLMDLFQMLSNWFCSMCTSALIVVIELHSCKEQEGRQSEIDNLQFIENIRIIDKFTFIAFSEGEREVKIIMP